MRVRRCARDNSPWCGEIGTMKDQNDESLLDMVIERPYTPPPRTCRGAANRDGTNTAMRLCARPVRSTCSIQPPTTLRPCPRPLTFVLSTVVGLCRERVLAYM
eukprot:scaffold16305_cov124-Isochrysis_galbana.AAC.5